LAGPLLAAALNLAERSSKIFAFNMTTLLKIGNAGQCSKIHSAEKLHYDNNMPHPSGAQLGRHACNWCANFMRQPQHSFNPLFHKTKNLWHAFCC
jgi:hypothetical protein